MRISKTISLILKSLIKNLIHIFRIFTSPIRILPDFIIIGAQKSGTTSLYNYLTEHPSIVPAFKREPKFFDKNSELKVQNSK